MKLLDRFLGPKVRVVSDLEMRGGGMVKVRVIRLRLECGHPSSIVDRVRNREGYVRCRLCRPKKTPPFTDF